MPAARLSNTGVSIYESFELKRYKQTVTLNKAEMHGHLMMREGAKSLKVWSSFFVVVVTISKEVSF